MNYKIWQNISDETVNGPHQQILKYKKVLEEYWYINSTKYGIYEVLVPQSIC